MNKFLIVCSFVLFSATSVFAMRDGENEDVPQARSQQLPSRKEMDDYYSSFYPEDPSETSLEILQLQYPRFKALERFLTPFIPGPVTSPFFKKVVRAYVDMHYGQMMEIAHAQTKTSSTGKPSIDYGWNFPIFLSVQKFLLKFCFEATESQPKNLIDVGAGYGFDTIGMLLTKRARVQAMEAQPSQLPLLKETIQSTIGFIDGPNSQLLKRFSASGFNFLTFNISPTALEIWDGINVNKVIHFFSPDETDTFVTRVERLLKPKGRVFITCLTPSPDSKIEKFVSVNSATQYPGYLSYTCEAEVYKDGSFGPRTFLTVQKPSAKDVPAQFSQTLKIVRGKTIATTTRVLHYHTLETLTRALGPRFRILDSVILNPGETSSFDHMLSIVAEKIESDSPSLGG